MQGNRWIWLLAMSSLLGASCQEPAPSPGKAATEAKKPDAELTHAEAAQRWEHLARACEREGRKTEAARAWQEASSSHASANEHASALTATECAVRLLRGEDSVELVDAVNRSGCLLTEWLGRPADGLERLEEALATSRRLFPGDHALVARSLDHLADCLCALSRPQDALPLYQQGLEMRQRLFEGDHADVADSITGLASCHYYLGQYTIALAGNEESLAMRRRLYSGDHQELVVSLNNVAACLETLGKERQALPLLQQVLEMQQRLTPGDHLHVANYMNNLAHCLDSLSETAEALALHQQALDMLRRLFPGDHADVAGCLNDVAYCLASLGRSAEALPLYEQALAMTRRLFDGDHEDVATALNNLASCLDSLSRTGEAQPLHEETLAMRRRLFPGDHADVADALNNLAACDESRGRSLEALPRYEDALAMRRRMYGGDHREVASSLNNVANCLGLLGRDSEALPLHEEALAMRRRLFEGDHTDVASSWNNLACCQVELGKSAEALAGFQEALAMRRRLIAGDHPHVAAYLDNVGSCMRALERSAEALPFFEQALTMRRNMFPGDHPDVAVSLNNVGACLESLGEPTAARARFEEALAAWQRLWPGDHPDTLHVLQKLGGLELKGGAPDRARPRLEAAIQMLDGLRGTSRGLEEGDRSLFMANLGAVEVHDLMRRCQQLLGDPHEALRFAELGRARELLQRLDNGRFDALAEAERRAAGAGRVEEAHAIAGLRRRVEQAEAEHGRLVHALARTASDLAVPVGERQERMAAIAREMVAAESARKAALRERGTRVADLLRFAEPASPRQIAAVLRPGEALLFFCLDEGGQSSAFVMRHGSALSVVPLPGKRDAVRALVNKHLAALSHGTAGDAQLRRSPEVGIEPDAADQAAVSTEAKQLAAALVPHTLWEQVAGCERVFIIPDDTLARLPFETLPVAVGAPDTSRLWLDAGPPIAYSPSLSALCLLRSRAEQQGSDVTVVAVGNPMFEREAPARPAAGALIVGIDPQSQADQFGMRVKDVILSYGGENLESGASLSEVRRRIEDAISTGQRTPGPVLVRLWRQGEELEVGVQTGPLGVALAPYGAGQALALGYGDGAADEDRRHLVRTGELHGFGRLARLPGTESECKAIATAFADTAGSPASTRVALLLGQDATETRLFEAASAATYLHLATHGIADEVAGASLSALALTTPAAPSADDNGFLDLQDLLHRWRDRLSKCRMVVLSACRTTVGPQQKGEAIQALPVGFLYSGASSVIASLWSVNDASTAVLMSEFYRRLASREGAVDRLRAFWDARKALRKEPRYADPFHWAGFLYFGSTQ